MLNKGRLIILFAILIFIILAILTGIIIGMKFGIEHNNIERQKKEQVIEEAKKREAILLENQPKPRTKQELLEEQGWVHSDGLSESDIKFNDEIDEHHRRYITNSKDPSLKTLKSRSDPTRTCALSIRTIEHQNESILFDLHETNVDNILKRFQPKGGSFYTIQYVNPNEIYILRETTDMGEIGWFERRKKKRVEIDDTLKDALQYCGVKL